MAKRTLGIPPAAGYALAMADNPDPSQLPLFDSAAGRDSGPPAGPRSPGGAVVTPPDTRSPGARSPTPVGAMPWPPPSSTSPLAQAAAAFDDHLLRLGKTENTRRAFGSDLNLLIDYLGAARPVGTVKTSDLDGFLTWLCGYRGKPCSPKSLARRTTTLKVFFAWLQELGAVEPDPARALVHRPAEPPLPVVLADDEVLRLLAAAGARRLAEPADPRPALLLRLALDTGLKKGELARLRDADLAAEADPPSLLVRYDKPRWAEKERRVSFGPAVAPLLAAYRARYAPAELLFPCTPRNLEYILADLAKAAGLAEGVHFETLRWTAALRAWRAGMAPESLRARLGLSPITWADTERKLQLLDDGGAGPGGVSLYFPEPGARWADPGPS